MKNKSSVHPAAQGFYKAAEAYDRGRPEYPPDAVACLINKLGIKSGSVAVDLAAGTGKFTKLLIPIGAKLIAVEPSENMRRKLETLTPAVQIYDGTAEALPLSDNSADVVIVAQAFHWFNGNLALPEIHRILKPGGRLGLIWNVRDESLEWSKRLTEIIDEYANNIPRYRTGAWKEAFRHSPLFSPLQQAKFDFVQSGDHSMVLDRVASISIIGTLSEEERAKVLNRVQRLLDSDPVTSGRAQIDLSYQTVVYWCTRID